LPPEFQHQIRGTTTTASSSRAGRAGYAVFYDNFYPEHLWGKDLAAFLDEIYRKRARTPATFIGIEETVWFTTKYETADGFGLFACSDINRDKCPNLPKLAGEN
jgi:hypothetical protein